VSIAVLVGLDGSVVPELLKDDGGTVLQNFDDLVGVIMVACLRSDHALQAGLEAVRELGCHLSYVGPGTIGIVASYITGLRLLR